MQFTTSDIILTCIGAIIPACPEAAGTFDELSPAILASFLLTTPKIKVKNDFDDGRWTTDDVREF